MSTAPEFVYLRQIGYTGSLADMRNAYFNDLILGKSSPFGSDLPPDQGEFTTEAAYWSGGGVNVSPTSGFLALVYFTAKRTETIAGITAYTNAVAAAPTPTIARMAIYDVASNGDITLNSSTPNDTTLFAAVSTTYQKNFSAPFNKVAGRRYAAGVLGVNAGAMPNFQGHFVVSALASTVGSGAGPYGRRNGAVAGQADLPANVAAGSVGNTHMFPGFRLS
jgi:hypothetical protein